MLVYMKCNLKMNKIKYILEAWVIRHWYSQKKTAFAYLLWPLSQLFSALVFLRRFMYKKQILKVNKATCPVIVVGNICVGGAGKTPLVMALYFFLKEKGWRPGIVTRGYKGNYKKTSLVTEDSLVTEVGDEPLLLATKTKAAVVVARQRFSAIKYLLKKTDCNIILSDDGLQHYSMARDIEILVIDELRKQGNGLCFPAGPLREPLSRLNEVDMVFFNGGTESSCSFSLQADFLINLKNKTITCPVNYLSGKRVHAVTGIASPQRFFHELKKHGAEVVEHSYPDHYLFKKEDFLDFSSQDLIILTEKDAVKCFSFAKENMWSLPVRAFLNAKAIKALDDNLNHLRAN